jgi:hypothetical protein
MFAKVRSTFATTRSLAEVVREAFARHRDDARAVVDCSEAGPLAPARRAPSGTASEAPLAFGKCSSIAIRGKMPSPSPLGGRYGTTREMAGTPRTFPPTGTRPYRSTRAPEPESAPAESTQPAVRLDGDWIQTMDASSGDLYYCNLKTGESSWDPPPKVPPPTPQETASLLRAATMPRSVSVPRGGVPRAEPPPVPPREPKTTKEHPRRASSAPRDALPSATRPWERFSKRGRESVRGSSFSPFTALSKDTPAERYETRRGGDEARLRLVRPRGGVLANAVAKNAIVARRAVQSDGPAVLARVGDRAYLVDSAGVQRRGRAASPAVGPVGE